MPKTSEEQQMPASAGARSISVLLWIALSICWGVSVFTVIEEMCLATACSDTAAFTFFGLGMGWFGIAYFSMILILLWQRKTRSWLDLPLSAMVFSGIGAELRLLWIQKYIIGSWCPLCVSICISLFAAAILLLIEKVWGAEDKRLHGRGFAGWLAFVLAMAAAGLTIAMLGIRELTYT